MTIRIIVAGATGWTGAAVTRGILDVDDLTLVGAVARGAAGDDIGAHLGRDSVGVTIVATVEEALETPADVFVDLTAPALVKGHCLSAIDKGLAVLVGTSGLTAADFVDLDKAARQQGVGVFTGNLSLTAALMQHCALLAAKHVPEFEVMDYSWADKEDVPSGTARGLAEKLGDVRQPLVGRDPSTIHGPIEGRGAEINGVRVHSIRISGFTLRCEAVFGMEGERLVIAHEAGQSADPYVYGTVLVARRIGQVTGFVHGLDQLLFSDD